MPNQGGTTKRMKPSSLTVTGGGGFFYLSLPNKLPLSVLGCLAYGFARGTARLDTPGSGG